MKTIISLLVASAALFATPAFGYIDPGSGSAIMSAVIGFFVAAGIAVKGYWYKIKSLFTGSKPKEQQKSAPSDSA